MRGFSAEKDKKVIFTQGKRKITYTGIELNQPHLDLWTIIKKGYIDQDRDYAVFRSKEVLQAIGIADGGANRKVLKRNLENLKGAEITVIREDGSSIIFNLLNSVAWKDQYSNFAISLDLRILNMFDNSNYSYLDLILRQKLKSDLARWLYSFYRSHKKPFPMLAKTYMDLCGSKGKSLPKFKERLKKAHDELVDIKFLRIYGIKKDGLVCIGKCENLSHRFRPELVKEAIRSSKETLSDDILSERELLWIEKNGGRRKIGQMKEFDVDRMLKTMSKKKS